MLEKNYNVTVDSMAILVCHPNQKSYQEIGISDEQELIKQMVSIRREKLANNDLINKH